MVARQNGTASSTVWLLSNGNCQALGHLQQDIAETSTVVSETPNYVTASMIRSQMWKVSFMSAEVYKRIRSIPSLSWNEFERVSSELDTWRQELSGGLQLQALASHNNGLPPEQRRGLLQVHMVYLENRMLLFQHFLQRHTESKLLQMNANTRQIYAAFAHQLAWIISIIYLDKWPFVRNWLVIEMPSKSWSALVASLITLGVSATVTATNSFPDNCNASCQASIERALAQEQAGWVSANVSSDSFYANPANISDYAAGDIVRWEDVPSQQYTTVGYDTPPATTLSRFLYMSEDIDGNPIPASAFLLLPFTNQDGSGKPLRTVVWTHGTAGITRQCAPSNNKGLYYEWEGPFALVQQGYAVIAPDYAGQGSDIPMGFMYESGALHALDVSFALQAVRSRLQDRITHEWVVVGHSEGGMTAWRVNEREKRNATGGFLGAVSGAPALRPLSLIPQSWRLAGDGPVHDVVSIFVLQSISRLFPSIKVENYVSDIVASRIPIAQQGCLGTGSTIYGNLTLPQLYKNISWINRPDVIEWQQSYNGAGTHELAAPMLVLQGTADELVYANLTEWDYDQTCSTFPSSVMQLYIYPDLNHDFAFIAGQAQYLPWIRDRFENVSLSAACNKTTVTVSGPV
ncbi:hypothetical protein AO1008_02652 [Aspergillus oryzae 100-8]|uniref:AB hydrolase-1 domain-containing protein n=1 Tax=Aspergillus oryzae (strain 3.042) TaxID=1160506 RepID=I8IS67_ASPO3|nr:hypothetical protein Ao3042_00541 [Aspergillus oryzae 3.042]KDE76721.1 hypothetical protein AO1008_02652 [Aspergillus oryzae 100-8]|eukprot:EIT82261.1 hypothetical protein Ao3042_00541 [Aspergillus oryzae 3.042]